MEVRCASCNKLFRVSDDKITGTGIRFGCTKCGQQVKITRADFEQYKSSAPSSRAVAPSESRPEPPFPTAASVPETDLGAALPSFMNEEPSQSPAFAEPAVPHSPADAGLSGDGDLAKSLPAFLNEEEVTAPVAHAEAPKIKPAETVSHPRPKTEPAVKTAETKTAPAPKPPDAVKTESAPKPKIQPAAPDVRTVVRPPQPASIPSAPSASSSGNESS